MSSEDFYKILDEIEREKKLSWAERVEKSIEDARRMLNYN